MILRIDCEEGLTRAELARIEGAFAGFLPADIPVAVEILFVDGEEIRRLNRDTRQVDKVTDVLSYPTLEGICGKPLCGEEHPFDIDEEGRLVLGSLVVCKERAQAQAEEYGHSYERELHYLLVHGILHCLGYDHIEETDRAQMREKEEYILGKMGITREKE